MEMGSNTVRSQKEDPAWKHCEKFRDNGKVRLKCIYCGKMFKGGGIYRFKEHLAGQKGNGTTCSTVHPDVRLQMLEILRSSVRKKRPKRGLKKEVSGHGVAQAISSCGLDKEKPDYDNSGITRVAVVNNSCGLDKEMPDYDNSGISRVAVVNDSCDLNRAMPGYDDLGVAVGNSSCGLIDDGNVDADENRVSQKLSVRKTKKRVMQAHDDVVVNSNTNIFASLPATESKKATLVNMAVGRFFFDVGLPADAVDSPYFQPMIDAIASRGTGAVGPSYHDLRSCILKNSLHEVRYDVDHCNAAWERTGCSILVYEWSSGKCKTFINLLAYCPEGTIFLRSADLSHARDSVSAIFELLKETVEQVGSRNVLQVVTTSEERYVIAGKRLTDTYPSIFWTPSAGCCIDLMLQDIGELPRVKVVFDQAKSISRYIYSNSTTTNMIRHYTSGVDLIDLGTTRASTDFMTLKRMLNVRHNLQSMVTSGEWMSNPYSKREEGSAVLDCICSQSFWSMCDSITRLTDPLLRLLRIVSSQKIPSMGYVHAGLYRVKEAIKKELVTRGEYLFYWSIIDRRWEQLKRHPLHAAGFYLNPKFIYSLEGDAHLHIRSLLYDCIEKLVPEPNIQDKIMREIATYHSGTGDFGRKMAIRAKDTVHPTEWWLTYGGGCPNLARLAIRILSQTCCLIPHKVDKSSIEPMHENKNWLEHQRLSDLVYVQYNMSMKHIEQKAVDPLSNEHIDLVEDWIVQKEFCSEDCERKGWMDVEPPYGNVMPLGPQIDDIETLGGGFDDYEIFYGMKDGGEDTRDENTGNTLEKIIPTPTGRWY